MLVRVALANKMARIVWAMMARGGIYQLQLQLQSQPRKPPQIARTSERERARSSLAQQS
jgi:hypothetical protein